ncbi:uncharacterized protein LOC135847616 isoform X8 [Planococcus citri]|uniref:uncharacterized protein LOC135847616 isoform X8 n=1 Tax=Planococcus citri TaxID=170843 RepID=UPI0031F84A77
MDEITPAVFDIAQPTPAPLKDLSAIAVSKEIWRNEIHKHRMNGTIERFFPLNVHISSKNVLLLELQQVIYEIIDEYLSRFGPSATTWLFCQYRTIFHLHRTHRNSVLEVFDDFVVDYSGTIDYAKTAKRMMLCSSFTQVEKFAIASTYFFEDDIRRIWPSVCQSFDLNSMDFRKCPQLYYWICFLKNQLDKIPIHGGLSVDEVMLDYNMFHNTPSIEYFWNRVSVENRMRYAIGICNRDKKSLVTFVLSKSKLNDQQLDVFVNKNGCKLIIELLNARLRDHGYFQPTWNFIKNKMTEITFNTLVVEMLKLEQASAFEGCRTEPANWLYHCSLIWNDIPTEVKQSIVEGILSNTRLFETIRSFQSSRRFAGFLLIILSSATFEQRSAFWRECWSHLIQGTRSEDLLRMMKLCFQNTEEIALFKANILAESEYIRRLCSKLLSVGMFDELNDFVDFCWPDVQAAKNYKLQILQSNGGITYPLVRRVDELSVFIDDTFDTRDESSEFKNQLLSSPAARETLSSFLVSWDPSFEAVMKLVDTFVLAKPTVLLIKMRMISYLAETILKRRASRLYVENRVDRLKTPAFGQFLVWVIGNAEEAERFRQSYFS